MKTQLEQIGNDILDIVNAQVPLLCTLSEDVITNSYNKQNRNIKQLIGHLIDSASNNHQRIVRLQYSNNLQFPDYTLQNDLWIAIQQYKNADFQNLLQLWKFFNYHIVHIIKQIDTTKLNNYWCDAVGMKLSLYDMIQGYLAHMHLHINDVHELINQ